MTSSRPDDSSEFRPEATDLQRTAAEWRGRMDAGWAPGEEEAFAQWLEQDERHSALFAEMDATWGILDGAKEVSPSALGMPRQAERPGRGAISRLRWAVALGGIAAAFAAALVLWRNSPGDAVEFTETAAVEVGLVKRLDLPDGSVVRLNSDSVVEVRYTAAERRVHLLRGEGQFTVAKNPTRPFVVTASDVRVRAVGTVFDVALRPSALEVLVTEGGVRVDDAIRGSSLLPSLIAPGGEPAHALTAGKKAVVASHERPGAGSATVLDVSDSEISRLLGWQERRLAFESTPLSEIVDQFNRFNSRRFVIADPELAGRRFGGSFRADDPDTFAHLLATRSGVRVEVSGGTIVLRRAK